MPPFEVVRAQLADQRLPVVLLLRGSRSTADEVVVDQVAVAALRPPVHHHCRRHRAAADGIGADGVAAAHVVELPEVGDARQHDVVERAVLEFGCLGECGAVTLAAYEVVAVGAVRVVLAAMHHIEVGTLGLGLVAGRDRRLGAVAVGLLARAAVAVREVVISSAQDVGARRARRHRGSATVAYRCGRLDPGHRGHQTEQEGPARHSHLRFHRRCLLPIPAGSPGRCAKDSASPVPCIDPSSDGDLPAQAGSGSGNTMLPRTRRVAAGERRVAGDPERR